MPPFCALDQIKAKQMCRAIKLMGAQHLCACACPAAAASSRRNTFAYMSKTCSMTVFPQRLASVSKACCGPCSPHTVPAPSVSRAVLAPPPVDEGRGGGAAMAAGQGQQRRRVRRGCGGVNTAPGRALQAPRAARAVCPPCAATSAPAPGRAPRHAGQGVCQ